MIFELRPYQAEDVDFAMNHGVNDRPIHCAPTGSGKTIIQAFIAKREMDRGNQTAILTPREEIFNQTRSVLNQIVGSDNVATLRAGHHWNAYKPVHIVSWPTLTKRSKISNFWYPKVKRLLVDECHLSMAPRIGEILDYYVEQGTVIDGYTATPGRKSGKGLGAYYSEIKHVRSVRQLIKEGFLAPCEYWGGKSPDVDGLKTRQGDFEVKKLSDRAILLCGDVLENWLKLASDRHTLGFAVDIAHAEALCDRALKVGLSAAVVHSHMFPEDRTRVVEDFKSLRTQLLFNVGIASYGFDCPEISCIIQARPTKSLVFMLQCIGRGMRPFPGKTECMVLDHAGNTDRLGQAENLYRWRLDQGKKAVANWTRDENGENEEVSHTCEDCQYIFSGSRVCPKCGWHVPFKKRDVASTDEDLVPIGGKWGKRLPEGWPDHKTFYQMLIHLGVARGHKPGWAAMKFKEKVDVWPERHWMNLPSIPADMLIVNWEHKATMNWLRRKSYATSAARKKAEQSA